MKVKIKELRKKFLAPELIKGPYWESTQDLLSYDKFFGRRNGWKIERTLKDLFRRHPNILNLVQVNGSIKFLDWGCGPGTFSRAFYEFLKQGNLATFARTEWLFWDHSRLASDYGVEKLKELVGREITGPVRPILSEKDLTQENDISFLLISHVINENFSSEMKSGLESLIKKAKVTIWIESGRSHESNQLIDFRNKFLLDNNGFQILAPCPHSKSCPLNQNKEDWCHFGFRPPSESSQDGEWVKLQRELGVDSRYLSLSYIVLSSIAPKEERSPAFVRHIGKAKESKKGIELLLCSSEGHCTWKFLPKNPQTLWYKETQKKLNNQRDFLEGLVSLKGEKILSGEWINDVSHKK
jgi:ribosomal protein RSM22 (predicted rRNA methylase)